MKKFCSTCGSQLELSQRLCGQCGTVNPYYSSAFKLLSDQSEALEKLKTEKERIEKELLEKEQEQAEFKQQELLKKSKELQEKGLEESVLKQELQRVKEETEKYKQETYDLVKEVREEIQQIEADNRRLKQEIDNLAKGALQTGAEAGVKPKEKETAGVRMLWFILLGIIFLLTGGAVAYLLRNNATPQNQSVATTQTTITNDTLPTAPQTEILVNDSTTQQDTLARAVDTASTIPPINTTPEESQTQTAQSVTSTKPATDIKPFTASSTKIKSDLVGKRMSGCDIVIQKSSEIVSVSQVALIEKLPTGLSKYKCTVQINQDEETYTATPYVYYTSTGAFVKVDGTNCE